VPVQASPATCASAMMFAEPAVVVADRWQRLGLGSVLLERLTARALEVGIARFRGLVLAENQDAIRLFLHLGDPISRAHGRELELEIVLSEPDGLAVRLREFLRAVGTGLNTGPRSRLNS
jgi:GNAT superfamily N-acetyltransferase